MKIFIVDDNAPYLEQVVIRLKDIEGHDVVTATSIKEAEQLIENTHNIFDIAIFDMVFSEEKQKEGGLLLLKKLKQHRPLTKAIILTAYPTEKNEERARGLGIISYLKKQDDLDSLVLNVEKLYELTNIESTIQKRSKDRKILIRNNFTKKGIVKKKLINNELVVLKRWNSYTPNMPQWKNTVKSGNSKGGGYFLIWNNIGIALDPGFDFLHNLWRFKSPLQESFEISDLDCAILSHAHDDHCHDIEPIVSLLYKKNKLLLKKEKKFYLYASEATIDKYRKLLNANSFIIWKALVSGGNPVKLTSSDDFLRKNGIELEYLLTNHNEKPWSMHNSGVALKLNLSSTCGTNQISIGYTSDTSYFENLINFFSDVDILLLHFGNVGPVFGSIDPYDKNHLGINGCYTLINELVQKKPKLFLMGEFGEEEIGNDRIKVCELITQLVNLPNKEKRLLPMDIGLRIKLPNLDIFCQEQGHEKFIRYQQIVPHLPQDDDGIVYYSK